MKADIVFKYFPELTKKQQFQINALESLFKDWNIKINVVSRKDIDELYLRHVLHSMGIAKVIDFPAGTEVLDVGTGGGFPGIPLAILFPNTHFTLVDSIGKKIMVAEQVVKGLGLQNVTLINSRVEELNTRYHYIVSRAVAAMPTFTRWVKNRIKNGSVGVFENGIFYLKGGNLSEELLEFKGVRVTELKEFFEEKFFETKSIVYIPKKDI